MWSYNENVVIVFKISLIWELLKRYLILWPEDDVFIGCKCSLQLLSYSRITSYRNELKATLFSINLEVARSLFWYKVCSARSFCCQDKVNTAFKGRNLQQFFKFFWSGHDDVISACQMGLSWVIFPWALWWSNLLKTFIFYLEYDLQSIITFHKNFPDLVTWISYISKFIEFLILILLKQKSWENCILKRRKGREMATAKRYLGKVFVKL